MSAVPQPPPSSRYSLWQPAISAVPMTPASYRLPGGEGRDATSALPATPRVLFPLPGHSPLPLPHLPPPMGPPCLRAPIPIHQHPYPHHRHLHSLHPADGTSIHLASTAGKVERELCALGPSAVPASPAAGALIHRALTMPPDIRRPLPLVYNFTASELDSVLYGYVMASQNPPRCGMRHAMSGLRIHDATDRRFKTPICSLLPPTDAEMKVDKEPKSSERAHSESPREKSASRSLLDSTSFPEGISITQTMVGGYPHYSVFCHASVIQKGARFGPFTGRIIHPSEVKTNDDTNFMWEIFQDGKLSHFVDGRNSANNWLCFVNCARHAKEQNLVAAQCGEYIYYEACKDIPKGTELLVWYGDSYRQFMGIPVSLKGLAESRTKDETALLQDQEGYMCDRCGKVFSYKDYRDKHLKYTRCVDRGDRKFPCDLCSRSFEKKDRLRIHILHVHHKHRPHKCATCGKSFSQSSSLNKHIRVHSGERPYKCVYCSKAFTASSILRTHIRQHSGERPFKCKHCGKAFASHAAHDSHVRRTHGKDKSCVCNICGKAFMQKCELKFHMNIHPDVPAHLFQCGRCNLGFASIAARDQHSLTHGFSADVSPDSHATTKNTDAILE